VRADKWADNKKYPKPTDVSAPKYVELLFGWVQDQLDDEAIFPTEPGVPFPKDFKAVVGNIFRRVFRVYAHICAPPPCAACLPTPGGAKSLFAPLGWLRVCCAARRAAVCGGRRVPRPAVARSCGESRGPRGDAACASLADFHHFERIRELTFEAHLNSCLYAPPTIRPPSAHRHHRRPSATHPPSAHARAHGHADAEAAHRHRRSTRGARVCGPAASI
jgi:hypothetical protein